VCETPDFRLRGAGTNENINRGTKPESVENKRRDDLKARMLLIIKVLAVIARILLKINRLSCDSLGIHSAAEGSKRRTTRERGCPSHFRVEQSPGHPGGTGRIGTRCTVSTGRDILLAGL
jgi:hypothetical protein